MRYETIDDLEEREGLVDVYSTNVVVTSTYMDADGDRATQVCEYWENYGRTHPFTRYFSDMDEAIAYARTFGQEDAEWAHSNGNGPAFMGVSLDVVRYERDWSGELGEGSAVLMREWVAMDDFEEISFDADGNQLDGDGNVVPRPELVTS